jgi:hypothetical protein
MAITEYTQEEEQRKLYILRRRAKKRDLCIKKITKGTWKDFYIICDISTNAIITDYEIQYLDIDEVEKFLDELDAQAAESVHDTDGVPF